MIKEAALGAREEDYRRVLGYLPLAMAREIREIERTAHRFSERVCEIRVRAGGPSSLIVGSSLYPLFYRAGRDEVRAILNEVCEGAPYAHRATIAKGYISVGGIRIGVSGYARYDGDEVGVGEISSLVFRLSCAECSFAEELYSSWRALGAPNLCIAAPPLGGKTTALAALANYIGSGREAMRVVIVDERCEFDSSRYRNAAVDVLRGYRRADGIELAYRTMAAEVIIADEIATRAEAEALLSANGAGVRLISSVHAEDKDGALGRASIAPLLEAGAFGALALIKQKGAERMVELSRIERP